MKKLAFALVLVYGGLAVAGAGHHETKIAPHMDRIAALVGTWEGTATPKRPEAKDGEKQTVTYTKTAGGSAVIETMMPGTPMEMTSVYNGGMDNKLTMTHYCLMGNAPQMKLKKVTDTSMEFEMVGKMKGPHMHGVKLTMSGPDKLTQVWTSLDDKNKKETVTIELTRKTATN